MTPFQALLLRRWTTLSKIASRKSHLVKKGDVVLLPEFGGNLVKVDGEELFLYNEEALLGVFSE